jgi:hypothetical protein
MKEQLFCKYIIPIALQMFCVFNLHVDYKKISWHKTRGLNAQHKNTT